MKKVLLYCVLVCFCAFLDPYADAVNKGNAEYSSGKFEEALESYSAGDRYAPSEKERDRLAFNQGTALYKAGKYDESITRFERSIKSGDNDLQKKAFFNIGNAYAAKGEYEHALEAYVNALKIDPEYTKAKKNIEYIFSEQEKKEDQKEEERPSESKEDNKEQGKNRQQQQNGQQQQNDGRGESSQNQQPQQSQSQEQIDMAQVMNLLNSLKQKSVERRKGASNMERRLEKEW